MDEKIRLIKTQHENKEQQKVSQPLQKRRIETITKNSPIIKRFIEEEARKKRRHLSDDELIELEFKEEADAIRAAKTMEAHAKNEATPHVERPHVVQKSHVMHKNPASVSHTWHTESLQSNPLPHNDGFAHQNSRNEVFQHAKSSTLLESESTQHLDRDNANARLNTSLDTQTKKLADSTHIDVSGSTTRISLDDTMPKRVDLYSYSKPDTSTRNLSQINHARQPLSPHVEHKTISLQERLRQSPRPTHATSQNSSQPFNTISSSAQFLRAQGEPQVNNEARQERVESHDVSHSKGQYQGTPAEMGREKMQDLREARIKPFSADSADLSQEHTKPKSSVTLSERLSSIKETINQRAQQSFSHAAHSVHSSAYDPAPHAQNADSRFVQQDTSQAPQSYAHRMPFSASDNALSSHAQHYASHDDARSAEDSRVMIEVVFSKNSADSRMEVELSGAGDFALPPTTLLNIPLMQEIDIDGGEIDLKANNLVSKLRVFKINGDIVEIYSGPVVTTFEFRPASNVKVSSIRNLQDDLSMELMAKSIRIQAPIPGKNVVGVEIPNNKIQTIYIREIFESKEFRESDARLAIALGKDVIGRPVVQDLAKLPHLLIAGTTGSGKSVGLNGMILSLLYKNTPKDLRFIMIDPKMVELNLYKDIAHLLTPIIADSKKAIIALSKAVDEMNRRFEIIRDMNVKDIEGYNTLASAQGLEKLPYIVIIIDEFADLMIMGGRDAEQYLISLASKARASGIHLIIATQRPTANVVTGLIKSNLPSKISYKVGTKKDSQVILDEVGAESLLGNGDLLFKNSNSIVRLHAPFSHEKEIERVADFIRNQQKVQYDESFSAEKEEQNLTQSTILSSDADYYTRAKAIMIQENKTSISYLQRALGIGYNKAASIVEQLEQEGFLSKPNSKNIREIIGEM